MNRCRTPLHDQGLVRTVHGRGTFVADPLPAPAEAVPEPAAQPHMPTAEYTELSRRIDDLATAQTALLRLLAQAGRPDRHTAGHST
ncbi:hypothetical protein [Streptomyces olivaceoviridis]|uniref:hypothetical protein n=1 Tax=Streptomyces olivaceoviridis TaxID=1921 RepID=UPI0036B7EEAA